jgi:hypothetical protein
MIKERQPEIIVHVDNHEYDLGIYNYINYKDNKVLDWTYINVDDLLTYINVDDLENYNDKVIIYI